MDFYENENYDRYIELKIGKIIWACFIEGQIEQSVV